MKTEYKCVAHRVTAKQTENMLNELAKEGWRLVCSYSSLSLYLILERKVK